MTRQSLISERERAEAPDFAPLSETSDVAPSFKTSERRPVVRNSGKLCRTSRKARSDKLGGYVWQAGNERERNDYQASNSGEFGKVAEIAFPPSNGGARLLLNFRERYQRQWARPTQRVASPENSPSRALSLVKPRPFPLALGVPARSRSFCEGSNP